MEPKFQSSFIPKGPIAAGIAMQSGVRDRSRSMLSFLAVSIFALSVVSAAGVFLYKVYLNYDIEKMGATLESTRAALSPEIIEELVRLNNRIVSTEELINKHRIVSPIFEFLEESTPKTVRFTDFNFASTEKGLELKLAGLARSYAALAFQADIINKSPYFKNPIFSDLSLDERGNVFFSLSTFVDPELLSYTKDVERTPVPVVPALATTTPETLN